MRIKKSFGSPHQANFKRAKWGQNFLRDKAILKKIADFAQIEKEDIVVEVGPGEGTLTEFLLERAKKVIAIEKDNFLAEKLKEKFSEQITDGRLQVITEDVLEFRNSSLETGYILVGNIPYYITGALFKKFLESKNPPQSIIFVVQKEVAARIMASEPNSAKASRGKHKESILSISIKAYGTPQYGGTIKAGSFHPKPKVDSAIIAVRNINRERFAERQFEKNFFEILKKGFSHKRKLLLKNLGVEKDIFKKCAISEKARAENLSVEDWLCLTKCIFSP